MLPLPCRPAAQPASGTDRAASHLAADPRLKPAAHEFEACLMKEFLEPLQQDALFADGRDESDASDSALTSFGSEALGKAISERGGFGIADRILRDLEKPTPVRGVAPAEDSPRNGGKQF